MFALSALIEGAWSHISGCHVPQRNAFNVSHSVQYKREGWHICIENTTFKNPLRLTSPSDHTNSKRMCVCVCLQYVYVFAGDLERECPCPCITHTHALVIQTIFLSVPISTIQTLPGMFSRGNVLHMIQTQYVLLGMYVKLGKRSRTWYVNDTFVPYWHSV